MCIFYSKNTLDGRELRTTPLCLCFAGRMDCLNLLVGFCIADIRPQRSIGDSGLGARIRCLLRECPVLWSGGLSGLR